MSSSQNWSSLIDFSKIPGGIITGLEGAEIEMLGEKSMGEVAEEELDEEVVAEMDRIEQLANNKGTAVQTERYGAMFIHFLKENNLNYNLKNMQNEQLNNYLRFFYSKLRTKSGDLYSTSSLLSIRCSLNRYFNSNVLKKNINICHDNDFISSNKMLKSMIAMYLKQGKPTKAYLPLEITDLEKISAYFKRNNPTCLQDEIIFNILFYFGQRGRENLKCLKKEDLVIKTVDDKCWIEIGRRLESKNVNYNNYTEIKQAMMFEDKENLERCPVAAYKFYLSKLPQNSNELFPKPLQNFYHDNWYSGKCVRGKDYLGNLLKNLSNKLQLSKIYTNHCVRSTVVSTFMDEGFDPTEIAAVTGHKSFDAMRKYGTHKRHQVLEKLSSALTTSLHYRDTPCTSSSLMEENEIPRKKKVLCTNEKEVSNNNITCSISENLGKNKFENLFGSGNSININTLNVYINRDV